MHSKRCSFHERSKSIVMNYSVEGARILSGGSPDLRAGWQSSALQLDQRKRAFCRVCGRRRRLAVSSESALMAPIN